ncbi:MULTISPECIES: relaxase/mobilization nuclease domain-containing protein [unclassified Coleofasciculus]|uniref:relaxase/mobilization nuclease domain-containing protein n=1 Tax=unclassified Coleofasciculus TaxID=2692782 RepID=UPI001880D80E|nr:MULTISPECIES: relaxase/mobilization nuclease domain-containing protein [unclassified Coleofasciculus]MBE9128705.1 relaxase/mobilization nuclease domain-containing protein [Coleofasciculus sp. LEGE 07081]MBE9149880.1 relaxase/mobilization nuclease domain-containing protein [Coleofasciculus sp. LEGE 07092]
MIGKTVKGNGFSGVLAYVFEKPDAQYLGGNMAGKTPGLLAREFRAITQFNAKVKQPVAHISLSPSTEDDVSDQKALELINQYLDKIGFGDCQWVAVKHIDTEFEDKPRPHYHIVANRVRQTDHRVVSAWRDWRRSEIAIRELEQEFNLTEVTASWDYEKRNLTNGQWQKLQREQSKEVPVQIRLLKLIDHCAEGNPTMPEFIKRLKESDVKAKVHFQSTGRVQGLTYELEGTVLSGTKLGKAYTFNGVQKFKGVLYESGHDNPFLKEEQPPQTPQNTQVKHKNNEPEL